MRVRNWPGPSGPTCRRRVRAIASIRRSGGFRRVVEPDAASRGRYIETAPSGDLRFGSAGGYWLDVAVFEETLDALLPQDPDQLGADDLQRLSAAGDLYGGDLLAGVFDDWALTERERLRARYLDTQVMLMRAYRAHGDVQGSLDAGRRALAVDSLDEDVHREIMGIHRDAGQSAQAVRQYDICRRLLERELGIAPDARTQNLRSRVAAVDSPSADAEPGTGDLNDLLELLHRAGDAVHAAERLVGEALEVTAPAALRRSR